MSIRTSSRSKNIVQSAIRSMTRECLRVKGINMAQGVCDLDLPPVVAAAAKQAIDDGKNIYMSSEGHAGLRRAIADRMKISYGMDVDHEQEIMVSAGATGAFYAVCLALFNRGDEIILFEPYYGYHDSILKILECVPVYSRLKRPEWTIDTTSLASLVTDRTRAIMINTPSNPAGKVFTADELQTLGDFAEQHDLIILTDEIYESFVYDGLIHIPPASLPGLRHRTVTISGFSKIFSITGWRLGYAICPPDICRSAIHFNDQIYVCAPSPLQIGAAAGLLELGMDYYRKVAEEHQRKRDIFCHALDQAGLSHSVPQGAYYVLADISRLPGDNDIDRTMHILRKTGVASVPGSAFYHDDGGRQLTRFCFAKKPEVLAEACERLTRLIE